MNRSSWAGWAESTNVEQGTRSPRVFAALNVLSAARKPPGARFDNVTRVRQIGLRTSQPKETSTRSRRWLTLRSELLRDVFGEDKLPVRMVSLGLRGLPLGVAGRVGGSLRS